MRWFFWAPNWWIGGITSTLHWTFLLNWTYVEQFKVQYKPLSCWRNELFCKLGIFLFWMSADFFSKLTCKKIFKSIIKVSSSLDPDQALIWVLSWADNTSRQEHYTFQSSLINRGSYMSAHVFLNLSNELGEKRKNVRPAQHFISFLQWVNTRAQMLDDIKIWNLISAINCVWFGSLSPINNLSVIKGWIFLGWTST